ncbi:hypothetical protein NE237_023914 [Protea cynaroides]|uniref:Cucumisin n=1 Tax=Protea cynaroides TaxID=273540 RepID=A0A9Q0HDU8_9MAGN|nr:hypothetical protein NE237_023914 [Protea cynaroides]
MPPGTLMLSLSMVRTEHIDPVKAVNPGLVYEALEDDDYIKFLCNIIEPRMTTLVSSSFSLTFILVLIIAVCIHCGATGEDRKVYIVYMGAVLENQYSLTSQHLSMLEEVLEENKIIGARVYSNTETSKSARDLLGHGTHTASTVVGNLVFDVGFYGLAQGNARGGVPSARIAVYKVCGDVSHEGCSDSSILAAFDDAIADGVDIISISVGGMGATAFDSDSVAIGAFHAMEKGILTSHSAGNDGPIKQTTVSIAPWLLSVAASSTDRHIISKVSLGDGTVLQPDITAPGVEILAAYSPVSPPSPTSDTRSVKYSILSGTSMSCPHATGVAAYVKSFHPDWSASAIKSALMTTAWSMNATRNSDAEFAYGAGHIDPVKAVDPGLVYVALKDDYIKFLCNIGWNDKRISIISRDNSTCPKSSKGASIDLNYPSMAVHLQPSTAFVINFPRRVTNVGSANSTYKASVISDSKIKISVKPEVLSFTSLNEEKSFVVTVSGSGVPQDSMASASLVWSDGTHIVRSPIVVYSMIIF